jgi:striatin 1/3/4
MKSSVTSLALDLSGLYLISGSHDGSIRVWDIHSKRCVQDMSNEHRVKNDEGIHCIEHHSSKNIFSSSASDSIVKLFQ